MLPNEVKRTGDWSNLIELQEFYQEWSATTSDENLEGWEQWLYSQDCIPFCTKSRVWNLKTQQSDNVVYVRLYFNPNGLNPPPVNRSCTTHQNHTAMITRLQHRQNQG